MTYYFLFVMLFLVLAYFVDAIVKHTLKNWLKATLTLIFAGVLGVAANLPNIYHTYQYAKESMRGKAELTKSSSNTQKATDGLDRDYITMWSYGIDETLTLLIPDYKGGGSASILDRENVEDLLVTTISTNVQDKHNKFFSNRAFKPILLALCSIGASNP